MLAAAVWAMQSGAAVGASSSVTVTMNVPSTTTLTNSCLATSARAFNVVQPHTPATTASGAGACQVSWSSSNDTSRLRIVQSDRSAPAMASSTTSWNAGRSTTALMVLGVHAFDSNVVFTANEGGEVLRTANAGGAWASDNVGTVSWLFDVEARSGDNNRWVVVGGDGFVSYTTNGVSSLPAAATWTNRSGALAAAGWPAAEDVQGVAMLDATNWIVGGDSGWFAVTANSGASWTAYQVTGVGSITDVDFVAANEFVATTSTGRFLRTTTGGPNAGSWTTHNPVGGDFQYLSDLVVANASNIYVASWAGSVFRWNGTTFDPMTQPARYASSLQAVAASSAAPATVWVSGDHGITWRSTDSGVTWTRQQSASASTAYAGAAVNGTTVVFGFANGDVTRTTDAGGTWPKIRTNVSWRPLLSIDTDPVDGRIAAAVGGDGDIYRTTNKGGSWASVSSGVTDHLFDVAFGTSATAWAVGQGGRILRSTNGGAAWTTQTSSTTDALRSVAAVSDTAAWSVGDDGRVMVTTNGGTSWVAQNSNTTQDLVAIAASSTSTAVLLGGNGIMRRTVDGGANWTAPSVGFNNRWEGVASTGPGTFIAISHSGDVYRSTDSGDTWAWVSSTWNTVKDLSASGDAASYVTFHGQVGRSLDGGLTWTTHTGPMSRGTMGIAAVDYNSLFSATAKGSLWDVDESAIAASQIADYAGGANFSSSGATGMFGVCLQSLTGATVDLPWVVDGGTCTATDADPWRAVPTTVTNVASATLGTTGTATFVWGVRPRQDQPPGIYSAGVTFEAIAPMA
jgi:photosystem II stability/assembly factor-like uncharacterized protein